MPKEVVCLGIDLAWSHRNQTGLAVMHLFPASRRIELVATSVLQTDREILAWVNCYRSSTTVIGIDAPIIAPNPAGTGRRCDREVTSLFGRYHAGTYPANRQKCQRPIKLRRALQRLGFSPDPNSVVRRRGCRQIEVYPHPAQIALFDLPRIIKYKKGRPKERLNGLRQLAAHIRRDLHTRRPQLRLSHLVGQLCTITSSLRGRALKHREDQLDALVCAYIAGHFWFWGYQRWRVIGDVRRGYIVCPEISKWG